MTDLRKAAEMALDALMDANKFEYKDEIAALRQALARSEQSKYSDIVSDGGLDPRNKFDAQQEPVAWANPTDLDNFDMKVRTGGSPLHTVPLYTAPPKRAWVGLTDEERVQVFVDAGLELAYMDYDADMKISKVIEAKLKEKNT